MSDKDHIAAHLRKYAVRVDSLMLDPTNARTHPEKQLRMLAQHLDNVGQVSPILFQTIKGEQIVRVGNARLLSARRLGWKYIAAISPKLTKAEWNLHALADNKLPERASWDERRYRTQLRDIINKAPLDASDFGYSNEELAEILDATVEPEPKKTKKAKRALECTCPHCDHKWSE